MNLIKNNLLIKPGLVHLVSCTIVVQLCDMQWMMKHTIDRHLVKFCLIFIPFNYTTWKKKMCTGASWLDWTLSSQLPFSTSEVNTNCKYYYYWYNHHFESALTVTRTIIDTIATSYLWLVLLLCMKQLVESVLSKVVEEFEHRIASQIELVCLLCPVNFCGPRDCFH